MNEAAQRLLPAGLLTLALHSAFLSWQMENRPIELPKPEKISVTLKKPPPPPPPPPGAAMTRYPSCQLAAPPSTAAR